MNFRPKARWLLLACVGLCGIGSVAQAADSKLEAKTNQVDRACLSLSEILLDQLVAGEYEAAAKPFNKEMKKALPKARLQQAWESLLANFGVPELRGEPQGKRVQGLAAIYTPLKFQRGNLVSQVACDVDGKIAGFYVVPEAPAPTDKPTKPAEPVEF